MRIRRSAPPPIYIAASFALSRPPDSQDSPSLGGVANTSAETVPPPAEHVATITCRSFGEWIEGDESNVERCATEFLRTAARREGGPEPRSCPPPPNTRAPRRSVVFGSSDPSPDAKLRTWRTASKGQRIAEKQRRRQPLAQSSASCPKRRSVHVDSARESGRLGCGTARLLAPDAT